MKFETTEVDVVVKKKINRLELTDDELMWLCFICCNISGDGKIREFTNSIWDLAYTKEYDRSRVYELFSGTINIESEL